MDGPLAANYASLTTAMMEEVTFRPTLEYIPPLPPKAKQKSTTYTHINSDDKQNGLGVERSDFSSMHSLVLKSEEASATVFIATTKPDQPENTASPHAKNTSNGPHVVTIRINTDDKLKDKTPKISSVHLKSNVDFDTVKVNEICKKNSSFVRLNVEESQSKILKNEEALKTDKPPYINCNSYSMTNLVMSSGQCSPSDTLDSGTCSDLDGTPPPLPKKKCSKSSARKAVSVTVINSTKNNNHGELDYEDNDSNISCDSLNSSELNGSIHADESHNEETNKKQKNRKKSVQPPVAPQMPLFPVETKKDNSFLPQGLLQDIRDRSAKLNAVETESESKDELDTSQDINENANISKESAQLTLFRLVSQFDREAKRNDCTESLPVNLCSKTPLISESTYDERKTHENPNQKRMSYSSYSFDADKYYVFHLNEKQFDEVPVKDVSVGDSEVEFFAGIKDFKNEEAPSTIRSSKGTIRGVKNRVRAGIATFLQINTTTKSYREKDAGKVVLYSTTMGIVRSTHQRCVLIKKILRNLLVKYEERDVFMSTEYQDEIRDRMKSDQILIPQLFVDGYHVGDADTVERLNESGELRKMLKPYKSLAACNTCRMCGGFRLLPCRVCSGSKKSLHRNHFTAEFVALKCMNCDEVGLVKCEACS